MAIFKDGKEVLHMYKGGLPIQKVYKGGVEVFTGAIYDGTIVGKGDNWVVTEQLLTWTPSVFSHAPLTSTADFRLGNEHTTDPLLFSIIQQPSDLTQSFISRIVFIEAGEIKLDLKTSDATYQYSLGDCIWEWSATTVGTLFDLSTTKTYGIKIFA